MPVFELRPSRQLTAVVLAATTGGGMALAVAQLPWQLAAAGALILALVALQALRPGGSRVVTLAARDDGRWAAHYADGRVTVGVLSADSFTHPWLCVVVLRDGWRRVAVNVPADALTRDAHRRLRLRLRWLPKASVRPAASWSRQSPWPG